MLNTSQILSFALICCYIAVMQATGYSPSPCTDREFQCSDGECLQGGWLCDTEVDCTDGLDERDCPTDCTGSNQLLCSNGRCVAASSRCDGDDDCGDHSDEIGCDTTVTPEPARAVEVWCCEDLHQICIVKHRRCDGVIDCFTNGADEKDCDEDDKATSLKLWHEQDEITKALSPRKFKMKHINDTMKDASRVLSLAEELAAEKIKDVYDQMMKEALADSKIAESASKEINEDESSENTNKDENDHDASGMPEYDDEAMNRDKDQNKDTEPTENNYSDMSMMHKETVKSANNPHMGMVMSHSERGGENNHDKMAMDVQMVENMNMHQQKAEQVKNHHVGMDMEEQASNKDADKPNDENNHALENPSHVGMTMDDKRTHGTEDSQAGMDMGKPDSEKETKVHPGRANGDIGQPGHMQHSEMKRVQDELIARHRKLQHEYMAQLTKTNGNDNHDENIEDEAIISNMKDMKTMDTEGHGNHDNKQMTEMKTSRGGHGEKPMKMDGHMMMGHGKNSKKKKVYGNHGPMRMSHHGQDSGAYDHGHDMSAMSAEDRLRHVQMLRGALQDDLDTAEYLNASMQSLSDLHRDLILSQGNHRGHDMGHIEMAGHDMKEHKMIMTPWERMENSTDPCEQSKAIKHYMFCVLGLNAKDMYMDACTNFNYTSVISVVAACESHDNATSFRMKHWAQVIKYICTPQGEEDTRGMRLSPCSTDPKMLSALWFEDRRCKALFNQMHSSFNEIFRCSAYNKMKKCTTNVARNLCGDAYANFFWNAWNLGAFHTKELGCGSVTGMHPQYAKIQLSGFLPMYSFELEDYLKMQHISMF